MAALAITNLEDAANQRIRQAVRKPYTTIGCGSTTSVWTYYSEWWDSGDTYYAGVQYERTTDCKSAYIEYSEIEGEQSHSAYYWNRDQYANGKWVWGCQYIGSNTLVHWLDVSYPVGYWYEQYTYSGSNCTIFDDSGYTGLGPLD